MSVTTADRISLIRNEDGLHVCVGCGAPAVPGRAGLRYINHFDPCPEAEKQGARYE